MYTTSSSPFGEEKEAKEEREKKKKRERGKEKGYHKLLGFSWEFYHLFGNFAENSTIFKFPKFPDFFGNSTKVVGFFANSS